ncbi:MAG: hypothetical protein ACI85U_003439, partial [Candidatus Promineifilaceae bacterium]
MEHTNYKNCITYLQKEKMRISMNPPLIRLSIILCALFPFFFSDSTLTPAFALNAISPVNQQESADCNPTDIVILIDESGSMYTTNDKGGNRFAAARTIVDTLANHAIWLCAEDGIQHRIAVVGFGDRSKRAKVTDGTDNPYLQDVSIYQESTLLPESIGSVESTDHFKDWELQRSLIREQLSANRFETLGATDHLSAFKQARAILDEWQINPLGTDVRRQAVFLLTDGSPCRLSHGCWDSESEDWESSGDPLATKEISELLDRSESVFPFRGENNPESVHISVVLLSESSAVISKSRTIWEPITND